MSQAETRPNQVDDPLLTFEYIWTDLGVSPTTFFRKIRPLLSVIEVSDRLRRVRRSDYEALKASRLRFAKAA